MDGLPAVISAQRRVRFTPTRWVIITPALTIESFHRQLRKATHGKALFPSDESLLKMLYLVTMDVVRHWTYRVAHWGQILAQLCIVYPERVNRPA